MFRIVSLTLFFQFVLFSVAGQEPAARIDSLEQELSQSPSPYGEFRITRDLIKLYSDVDQTKTISLFERLIVLSSEAGISLDGDFNDRAGYYCRQAGDYHRAKKYYQKAVVLYRTEKKINKVTECLAALGYIMYVTGDYSAGMKICFFNLKLIEMTGYKNSLAMTYTDLGFLLRAADNYNESINFFQHAVKAATEIKDTLLLFTAYNEIGNSYNKIGKYSLALKFQKLSLDLKLSDKGKYSASLGYSYNDIATTFTEIHEYDTAIYYLHKVIEINFSNKDDWILAFTYSNLGECYYKQGNYQKAIEYMNLAHELSRKSGIKTNLFTIYKYLSDLHAKQNNYKKAFDFLILSVAYKDSVFNIENQRHINELRTIYKTEKKDKEIILLNKDKEKQAEVEKKQMIIIISVILGLMLVSIFAGYAYRQKEKIKKEKKRSDELLLNILPSETAEELKLTGFAEPRQFEMATVMFTDFKGFTGIAEKMSAKDLVAELHYCFNNYDNIISRYPIEKIKTIGDSYMCAGGLPVPNGTNPTVSIQWRKPATALKP